MSSPPPLPAAGENNAAAHAGQNAAQQTGGEVIVHNGDGGNGNETVKKGVGRSAHQRLDHKAPPQGPVGKQENGHIERKVQNARNVIGAEAKTQIGLGQGAQQLAKRP